MLSFSLRAVLRKESWIFCAGLFSICRSPCKLDLQSSAVSATRGATAAKLRGDNPWQSRLSDEFPSEGRPTSGSTSVQYGLKPDFSTVPALKFSDRVHLQERWSGNLVIQREELPGEVSGAKLGAPAAELADLPVINC